MRSDKKVRLSFIKKLFICFTIMSFIPVLVLGTLTYTISSRESMRNLENQASETVDQALNSLGRTLDEYKSAISYFCKDEEIISMLDAGRVTEKSRTSIYQKMYIMLAGKPTSVAMHLIKADGSFSVSTSQIPEVYEIKNHEDWGVFRKLNSNDESMEYSNRYTAKNGIRYCMAVAHNIKKDNVVLGYVIMDIPEEAFKAALGAVNPAIPMKYAIADKNYYILYDETFGYRPGSFLDNNIRDKIFQMQSGKKIYLDEPYRLLSYSETKDDYQLRIISSVPVEMVVINSNYITVTTLAVAIGAILMCLILSPLIIRGLTKPLSTIIHTMNRVRTGDTAARVTVKNNDEFGYIGKNLNTMLDNLNELYQKDLEKQNRLRLAELKALHSQINPHFLYNTLDSIKWLAKLSGINDIVVMVSQLGRLLKSSINNQRDIVQISEEISLIGSYISIQKVRYSNKFEVDMEVDPDIMSCEVPKLIIQPIVENAIIHGIEDKIGKAHLKIRGWKDNDRIIFEITDDGVGMSLDDLEGIRKKVQAEDMGKSSIGLANVDKRIKLYYGEQYGLAISSEANVGTIMRVVMPFFEIQQEKTEGESEDHDKNRCS
ncbi:sensor histidine kinase [Ruminiclostridium cellobioparum]|uniref:Integral membrane sensor signal transduction histidine kinase n=1 Tax=Ruminiclostridium cellobioparum subsp. termitidis CT1112 TaxID=1195236 RepID=S0FGF5_RUMCE|nr:histidine kinase [Ruminiclostridium cellobioparum]EMS70097.1 integral membrane sensor signal transduction histidine kinase [Ruminiclostridium cellobioparum subsp. termitidis CT1112]